jgi:tRNA (guanine6-N2)-methyltransferase
MKYRLGFLKGTSELVLKELVDKYPDISIDRSDEIEISFESTIDDIEVFRNLYSPTHIENSKGKKLNLSRREWRVGMVPAGINPSLAYILCMISDLNSEHIVYDPFCGSSVIPITALKYFNVKRVICSDISGNAITMSMVNFKKANIGSNRYKLFKSDIRDVKLNKQNIDRIVSNLPFGIRVGNHSDNMDIYNSLELLARRLLRSKGKLILLTQEKVLLREIFKKDYWIVKSLLRVDEGGLLPELFVIQRR